MVIIHSAVLQLGRGGLVVECSPPVLKVVGSIPGGVLPKTLKMVLDALRLGTKRKG